MKIFFTWKLRKPDIKSIKNSETISFAKCLQGSKPIMKRIHMDINSNFPNKMIKT